jgi:hypothetical protein
VSDEFKDSEFGSPGGAAQQAASAGAPAPSKPKGGNKVLIVVAALFGLAVIGGIVAAFVLFFVVGDAVDDIEVRIPSEQEQPATVEETGAVAGVQPAPEVANDDVFTFRDIFKPLLVAPTTTTTTTSTTIPADSLTPTTTGTLYLQSIVTQDGVAHAVLRLDGTDYTLAAGESIPDTPWRVLRVDATSVVMLYGDTQVVLSIGQGITK